MHLRPPIVLFGDSITQFAYGESPLGGTPVRIGWASLLSQAYQRRADVLNRGFSGYNTRHALALVPKLFASKSGAGGGDNSNGSGNGHGNLPLFCTVFFGANDANLPSKTAGSGRQHVPKEEYGSNIKKIIASIRESTGTTNKTSDSDSDAVFPIIIITPPPVDDERWNQTLGMFDHYDRTNSVSREYGEVAKAVASSLDNNFAILDTWELLGGHDIEKYKSHLCDGLHLSDSGNQLLYEGLMKLIKTKFPHLAPAADEGRTDGIQVEEALWSELC